MNLPLMLNVRLNSGFQPKKNQTKHMSTKYAALLISLTALGALSASASQVTISGTALSGLYYAANTPADAQYVPANSPAPAYAQLYTADLSTAGTADSPTLFFNAPDAGLSSLGTVGNFVGSYDLYQGIGSNITYWTLWALDPSNQYIEIYGFGGTTINGSSAIHAFDPSWNPLGTWGETLSQLGAMTYDGATIGSMTVKWAGIEIGDGGSGPGTADIDSITVGSASPDGGSTLLLLGIGLAGLGVLSLRRNRLQSAK